MIAYAGRGVCRVLRCGGHGKALTVPGANPSQRCAAAGNRNFLWKDAAVGDRNVPAPSRDVQRLATRRREDGEREHWSKHAGWPAAVTVAAAALAAAEARDDAADCHVAAGDYSDLAGVWLQDKASCDSMDEFLQDGLGFPWFVTKLADNVLTTLKITFPKPGTCVIVDKTFFGRNETTVELGGPE